MSDAAKGTAAVLVYPGCTIAEVLEAATRLSNAGIETLWVSSHEHDVQDQSGLQLLALHVLSDIDPSSIDLLLVPGGDPATVIGDDGVRGFVRTVAVHGTVAGICAGVLVLADAGVLRNKAATHNYRPPWAGPEVEAAVAHLFDAVQIEPDRSIGVVRDASVITALPNAAAEFAITCCVAAGLYSESEAPRLVRHLQGQFVSELFDRNAKS